METLPVIARDATITAAQVEVLREAVGWERMPGQSARALARSYAHFSAMADGRLLAFVNVISDGVGDALLVDLMVAPELQGRGMGRALITQAIESLTADDIQCIEVLFVPELERFYRQCGFHIVAGGIIDNARPAVRSRRSLQQADQNPEPKAQEN